MVPIEAVGAIMILLSALITFCLIKVYWKGYNAGGRRVLEEWKKFLYSEGDDRNE